MLEQHSFQEVMRQMFRVHKACGVECLMDDGNHCPLYEIEGSPCGWLNTGTMYQVKQMEGNVMAWAAEHPEPVYPTWGEYLASIGVMKPAKPDEAHEVWFTQIYSTEIPTDIAEKLGIEPKEG